MLVYRLENYEGIGVFQLRANVNHDILAELEGLEPSFWMPNPFRDNGMCDFFETHYMGSYKFGCESLDQLRLWFKSRRGLEALAREGIYMVTYLVNPINVVVGEYQVAFHRSETNVTSRVRADQW